MFKSLSPPSPSDIKAFNEFADSKVFEIESPNASCSRGVCGLVYYTKDTSCKLFIVSEKESMRIKSSEVQAFMLNDNGFVVYSKFSKWIGTMVS